MIFDFQKVRKDFGRSIDVTDIRPMKMGET